MIHDHPPQQGEADHQYHKIVHMIKCSRTLQISVNDTSSENITSSIFASQKEKNEQ